MPVSAAVTLAPAALGFLSNAAQGIGAAGQLKKDKAELARLEHPFYKVQREYQDNYNQAAVDAQSGLTQGAKDLYLDEIGSGLGSSLEAITESGGGANDVASLFDSYSKGVRGVAVEDSERQLANIRYFQQTGKDLAGQKTQAWAINEYQPYQNKLKELTQRISADKQNIHSAIQGGIGAVQAGVTSMQNNSLLTKLFGDGGGGGVSDMPNGQQMWLDYKAQMERDNAAHGSYQLSDKFSTGGTQYKMPSELASDPELMRKVFEFINRPR